MPKTRSLRIRATCPSDDRRLPLTREIAGRDFKEYVTLASGNAESQIPILRDLMPRFPSPINGSDRVGESRLGISRGVKLSSYQSPNAKIPMAQMGFKPCATSVDPMAIGDLGLDPTVQICPLELLLQRLISEHLLPIQWLTEFPYEI